MSEGKTTITFSISGAISPESSYTEWINNGGQNEVWYLSNLLSTGAANIMKCTSSMIRYISYSMFKQSECVFITYSIGPSFDDKCRLRCRRYPNRSQLGSTVVRCAVVGGSELYTEPNMCSALALHSGGTTLAQALLALSMVPIPVPPN